MSITNVQEKTRYLLWAKTAGRCQFRGCNEPLWRDGLTQIEMNFGEVAHIIGDRPGGPRGHARLSKEYCNDINNLMLLCLAHHKQIDELYERYSEDDLRLMKQEHEFRIEQVTGLLPNQKSHVIVYRGNVGKHSPQIDISDAMSAMLPEWYPVSRYPAILGMDNSAIFDDEEEFWQLEEQNLQRQFESKVRPLLDEVDPNHFSVFAFAPQPLLIKLGTLLPDLFPAVVYQLHRTPHAPWRWQHEPDNFDFVYEASEHAPSIVALSMSLSAPISDERIERALDGQDFCVWPFTRTPWSGADTNFLKGPRQLELFRKRFRQVLDEIKYRCGEDAEIHVFPAVPVSIAVEMGRVWQPKSDLPMIVYDQNQRKTGFIRALTIKADHV